MTNSTDACPQKPAQVLIAHQSTIPSYRIRFYELLEQMRPPDWEFSVVFDEANTSAIDSHSPASTNWNFPVTTVPLSEIKLPFFKNMKWQNISVAARDVDVLILDTQINNLGYPLASLLKKDSTHLVFWGHTNNLNRENRSLYGKLIYLLKSKYVKRADSFFAYTLSQAESARQLGFETQNTVVLNNTVDITSHRKRYKSLSNSKIQLREKLSIPESAKVILVVGRLIKERRIDFLLSFFRQISKDQDFVLIVVGGGPEQWKLEKLVVEMGPNRVITTGPISSAEILAEYYAIADLFLMPGMVGLAPLEAICYGLPVIAFDLKIHSPEITYLTPVNSTIYPGNITPTECASRVEHLFLEQSLCSDPDKSFQSISHLTLENMVQAFIDGVTNIVRK